MYNDPSGHFIGMVGMCINSACGSILDNFHTLNVMGMISGVMNATVNQLLGGEDDPMTAYIKGYIVGFGFGAVYYGACAIAAIFEVTALVHMGMFAYLSAVSINELTFALCAGAVGNNKAALVHTVLAVLSIGGAIWELGLSGVISVTGPKGTVEVDISGKANKGETSSSTSNGNNSKRLYRVMSEAELEAVKSTGKLRGGRIGTTYFTDSYYKNANIAKSRLALPEKPCYIVEFEIKSNPNISGGTKVQPAYGEIGGGREYFTDDIVEVFIINYQKMVGGNW